MRRRGSTKLWDRTVRQNGSTIRGSLGAAGGGAYFADKPSRWLAQLCVLRTRAEAESKVLAAARATLEACEV